MRFADLFVSAALVVVGVVALAPLLIGAGRRHRRWSRSLWATGLLVAVLLVAQALVVDDVADRDGGPTAWDQAGLSWSLAHRVTGAVLVGKVLAIIGGPAAMALLSVVGAALLARARAWRRLAVVLGAGVGATALVGGFKGLYARDRPPPADQVILYANHSLPSGHALGSTVVVGILVAVLALRPGVGRTGRLALGALAAGFAVAVGLSRVYLAAHWVTDVVVGWLLGGAWLAIGILVLVLTGRPAPHAGAAPAGAGSDRH